jgi:hypothetical protein
MYDKKSKHIIIQEIMYILFLIGKNDWPSYIGSKYKQKNVGFLILEKIRMILHT